MSKFTKWDKINQAWNEIANSYFGFTRKYRKQLFKNYSIDSGTDFANYIFNIGDIQR